MLNGGTAADKDVRAESLDRPCPVCGGLNKRPLYRAPLLLPDGYPLEGDSVLVVCARCGSIFADFSSRSRDYERYYSELSSYAEPTVSSGAGTSAWDLARLRDIAGDIERWLPDRGARFLDIGCATGGLLRTLQTMGYTNLAGIDPSPACVQFVRESVQVDAWTGSIYELDANLGPFQFISLLGVLEHLEDPTRALRSARKLLAPYGLLLIEVPDAARYADFLVAPYQDFNSEHINHFSWGTLRNLLLRAGFEVVDHRAKIEQFGSAGYPAISGLFRLAGSSPRRPRADRQLERHIGSYMDRSEGLMREMDNYLRGLLQRSSSWVVWGTGQLCGRLMSDTVLGSSGVVAFVDNNPRNHGRIMRGIPIVKPSEVQQDVPILVASTLHEDEIIQSARNQWKLSNDIYGLRRTVDDALASDGRRRQSARA